MNDSTIESVVLDILFRGGDRAALVGPEFLCVFILSRKAQAELGAKLVHIAGKLGYDEIWQPERFELSAGLAVILRIAEEAPQDWFAFGIEIGACEGVAYVFRGRVTRLVANVCNLHHCPCSLDPKKAAPGYEGRTDVQGGAAL